ncbi:MAG: hypothetical protein EOP06_15205, partial [Proteobacteria bacterium]
MPSPKLNKPLQDLRTLLKDLQNFDFGTGRTHRNYDIADDFNFISLTREQAERMAVCRDQFLKALSDTEAYGAKDISKLIEGAILHSVCEDSATPPQRLKSAIQTLETRLSEPLPLWQVHQPVGGLHNQGLPALFGKVTFYFGDEETSKALKSAVGRTIARSGNDAVGKKSWIAHWHKEVDKEIKGKCYCRVEVRAFSEEAARSRALRELALTLDVINLFADVTNLTGTAGRLYLPGEAHTTHGMSLALRLPEKGARKSRGIVQNAPTSHISSYMAGPFSDFSMSEAARNS